jgi:hypothetical protein
MLPISRGGREAGPARRVVRITLRGGFGVDEGRDPERWGGAGHRIGGRWTHRPRAEPRGHALAQQHAVRVDHPRRHILVDAGVGRAPGLRDRRDGRVNLPLVPLDVRAQAEDRPQTVARRQRARDLGGPAREHRRLVVHVHVRVGERDVADRGGGVVAFLDGQVVSVEKLLEAGRGFLRVRPRVRVPVL